MSAEQLRQLELRKQAARERRSEWQQRQQERRAAAGGSSADAPPPFSESYVEFRLDELRDSRGGFFTESAGSAGGAAATGADVPLLLSTEQRRKRMRSAPPERRMVHDPPLVLPVEENPPCEKCGSIETEADFFRWFGVRVCARCRREDEMYSLVTKTVAKEDFLVTDSELSRLRFVARPNPHNSNWKDMQLYLYRQVYDYAIAKWGSEEKLNEAFVAKQNKRTTGKSKLFETHISDLRKEARTAERLNKLLEKHEHSFGPETLADAASNTWTRTCGACGHTVSFEKL